MLHFVVQSLARHQHVWCVGGQFTLFVPDEDIKVR